MSFVKGRRVQFVIGVVAIFLTLNIVMYARSLYEEGRDVSLVVYAMRNSRFPCTFVSQHESLDLWLFYQLGQYDGFKSYGYYPILDGRAQSFVPVYRLQEVNRYCRVERRGTLV